MEVSMIYFDMDGVLADFSRGVREICGLSPLDQTVDDPAAEDEMWRRIREADHFYDRLEPMPGALEMFRLVSGQHPGRCEILTAIPKKKRKIFTARGDKLRWMRRLFPADIVVHIVYKEEKKKFCTGRDCILIDDYPRNIEDWRAAGGTGILFRDAGSTVEELRGLGVLAPPADRQ